jgi:hypothetical protein
LPQHFVDTDTSKLDRFCQKKLESVRKIVIFFFFLGEPTPFRQRGGSSLFHHGSRIIPRRQRNPSVDPNVRIDGSDPAVGKQVGSVASPSGKGPFTVAIVEAVFAG